MIQMNLFTKQKKGKDRRKEREEKKCLDLWYRAALAQKQRVKHSQNTFGFQSSNLILADGPDLPFQASEGLQGGHHGVSSWPPHKRL